MTLNQILLLTYLLTSHSVIPQNSGNFEPVREPCKCKKCQLDSLKFGVTWRSNAQRVSRSRLHWIIVHVLQSPICGLSFSQAPAKWHKHWQK